MTTVTVGSIDGGAVLGFVDGRELETPLGFKLGEQAWTRETKTDQLTRGRGDDVWSKLGYPLGSRELVGPLMASGLVLG